MIPDAHDLQSMDRYQDSAHLTARYAEGVAKAGMPPLIGGLSYCALKMAGEAGEFSEKIGKIIRDKGGEIDDETRRLLLKELGDVMWYVQENAGLLNESLSSVAAKNLEKLHGRVERGTIHGSGDDR